MQIVKPLAKKYDVYVFIFHLVLVSVAIAELWLAFQLWHCFHHWPESAHTG